MHNTFFNITFLLKQFALSISLLLIGISNAFSQNLPAKETNRLSYDYAKLLSSSENDTIQKILFNYRKTSGNKLVVVTVESLEGYTIEDYAYKLFKAWELGTAEKDNGVLLLISKSDRKMRIEVGYGLEALLPDATCKHIINNDMIPNFKEGNFYGGIYGATNSIIAAITNNGDGEVSVVPEKETELFFTTTPLGSWTWGLFIPIIAFCIAFVFTAYQDAKALSLAPTSDSRFIRKTLKIALYFFLAFYAIDFIAISFIYNVGEASDLFGELVVLLLMRFFSFVFYWIFALIPGGIAWHIFARKVFKIPPKVRPQNYSSSKTTSDYSDSSTTSYSDNSYSDYSDSYSDYSDYSDSGGSSGGW